MTLTEILEKWEGGAARLCCPADTIDGKYVLILTKDGKVQLCHGSVPAYVPLDILVGNSWYLEYETNFSIEKTIDALAQLDPSIKELYKTEWNDWCRDKAENTVYAVARALGIKIKDMERCW